MKSNGSEKCIIGEIKIRHMEVKSITAGSLTNETIKTIYERRAVRKFREEPLTENLIEHILDAGRMAPSAQNKQQWKFYIVKNRELIHSLSTQINRLVALDFIKSGPGKIIKSVKDVLHFMKGVDFINLKDPVFHGAPVVIFITEPKDYEWKGLDSGMCAQNIMLAAKSLGVSSCPIGIAKYAKGAKSYGKLGIPVNEEVQLAIILGFGKESPKAHPRIKTNSFYIN